MDEVEEEVTEEEDLVERASLSVFGSSVRSMKSNTFGRCVLSAIFGSLLRLLSIIELRLSLRWYVSGVIVELLLLDFDDVPVALDSTDNKDGFIFGKLLFRERLLSRVEVYFIGRR